MRGRLLSQQNTTLNQITLGLHSQYKCDFGTAGWGYEEIFIKNYRRFFADCLSDFLCRLRLIGCFFFKPYWDYSYATSSREGAAMCRAYSSDADLDHFDARRFLGNGTSGAFSFLTRSVSSPT